LVAAKLAGPPILVLKGGQQGREEERLNAPILPQRKSESKPSKIGWVVKDMGKRNVCEALVLEMQALKSESETAGTILETDDMMVVRKTREEKTLQKGLEEGAEEGSGEL